MIHAPASWRLSFEGQTWKRDFCEYSPLRDQIIWRKGASYLPKSNLIFFKKCLDKWVHFSLRENFYRNTTSSNNLYSISCFNWNHYTISLSKYKCPGNEFILTCFDTKTAASTFDSSMRRFLPCHIISPAQISHNLLHCCLFLQILQIPPARFPNGHFQLKTADPFPLS